jgi:hypothetical protein
MAAATVEDTGAAVITAEGAVIMRADTPAAWLVTARRLITAPQQTAVSRPAERWRGGRLFTVAAPASRELAARTRWLAMVQWLTVRLSGVAGPALRGPPV